MRVMVTGATGFLGHHVVESLLARGHEPLALVRPSSDARRLLSLGVERRQGSLSDPSSLVPLLSDLDAVVHCAGGGRAGAGVDLMAQNAGTTGSLLEAIRRSGASLRRFVLVSSLSAHGPSPDGRPRPDGAPCQPRSAYGKSKAEAERMARAASDVVPVSIVRPPAIYGPGDDRWLSFFRAVRRGVIPVVGLGARQSVVYGPDCARAIVAAVERGSPSGKAYSVAEPLARGWARLGRAAARALGVRALPLPLPLSLVPLAGAAGEALSALRGKPAFLSRDKAVDASSRYWVCDPSPARAELGWWPEVDFEGEGASLTARWYRAEGLL